MSSIFQYSDGNGNRYRIAEELLEYIPVKKENSSSGFYSGGDPKSKILSPEEFRALRKLLMDLIDQRDLHIKDRVMMSGAISLLQEGFKEQFLIKPCEALRALEAHLQALLNKN